MTTVVRRELAPVAKRLDGMDDRFDSIDQRLDGIDIRLDAMDGRFDGIDHRLDGIDGRLDSIDQRFDDSDTKLDKILNVIGEIQDEQAGILAIHADYLDSHEKRIKKLERHSPLTTL